MEWTVLVKVCDALFVVDNGLQQAREGEGQMGGT